MDDLHDEAGRVAARLHRAHADLVDVTARVIEHEAWGEGYRSPEHWLVVRLGLSPARAKDVVRLARRRDAVPAVVGLLGEGRVSFDQAAVVARRTPASHEASVADVAEHLTVPQLNRVLERYVFDVPDAATDTTDSRFEPETVEQQASAPPNLSMTDDDAGRFLLRYDASAETGALVEQAVREAKDALFGDGRTGATHADALAEIASRSLMPAGPVSRRDRYRVYVHLSDDGAWVNGAGAIPPGLAAKFACDGTAQAVRESQGRPVSVGRAQRIVPDRTRRLITDRDRGCRYPGCTATRFVEVHHLTPWSQGGGTDFETNVSLCPHHHDELHRGEYTITGDPTRRDGLTVRNRRGLLVGAVPRPRSPGDPRDPAARSEPAPYPAPYPGLTDERLQLSWFNFASAPDAFDTG